MNSRERLLTAFNHRIPDRIPWSGLVTDYFMNSHRDRYGQISSSDFLKLAGADVFNWLGMEAYSENVTVETYSDGKLLEKDKDGNWLVEFYNYLNRIDYYRDKGTVLRKYITPLGELSAEFKYASRSQTVFISKYPVRKIQDYRIFTYMIESLEYRDLSGYFRDEENALGDFGLNAAMLHSTPVYELIQCFMGLECFHYFFFDYRIETQELTDRIFKKYRQCYEIYSDTVIPAVVIPEDAGTTLYSPVFFKRYLKPVIEEYNSIIKNRGKISVLHACGHLDGLKKPLSEIGLDCIESVSPPPTGNVSIKELRQYLPGVCIMGGIPANCYLLEPDAFKKYVIQLIMENRDGGNFILSSGDSIPSDARAENIESIRELADTYGRY